jgi:hypothetical protein
MAVVINTLGQAYRLPKPIRDMDGIMYPAHHEQIEAVGA